MSQLQTKDSRNNSDYTNAKSPSLRSFPLDVIQLLPPLYSTQTRIQNTIGANPNPRRINAEVGSIAHLSENGDVSEIESNVEISTICSHVCKHCQDSLLAAFEHCLSKNGDPLAFQSIHEIDEEQDAIIQTPPPLFDIVKDPTSGNKPPVFDDPHSSIERDRWVLQQSKESATKLDISSKKIKGLGVKTGKHFSGGIYKRMLDAKEKEITALRQKLFEALKREQNEGHNVRKLKQALNRSVNYYTFAEEWQKSESSRLQADVKHLKSELSSLMAFLINSEVEKQSLVSEMQIIQKNIEIAETNATKAIQEAQEMKTKLQDTFKEFIAMDETMHKLRKEALKGTDAVEARNIMLQKNLSKLTADFEVSSKNLRIANSKIRELEYELEQMIQELNLKGEALKKSTQMNATLKTNLENTTKELQELQKNHEQLILLKAKIEADGRQEQINSEHQRQTLKKSLNSVSEELNNVNSQKVDLELFIKSNKQEIEGLTKQLKTITADRDDITIQLKRAKQIHTTDVAIKEQRINELNNKISKDAIAIKALQDKKEQLMFDVVDLQNNLDNESNNSKSLLQDLTQLKRITEEKINLLNEQVEKLTSSKNNLINDKKELTDKIKSCRQDLREREDELDETIKKFDQFQIQSGNDIAALDRKFKSLSEDHKLLNKTHDALKERFTDSVKECVKLKKEREMAQKKQADTDTELLGAKNNILALMADKEEITSDLSNWKKDFEDLDAKYKAAVGDNMSVVESFEKYRACAENSIQDQNTELQKLTNEVGLLKSENEMLTSKKQELESSLADTEARLINTLEECDKVTATKDLLEDQLDRNRIMYQSEKRMRAELERVQNHIHYNESNRFSLSRTEWNTRDKKLADVAIGLTQEATRLKELVRLLPRQFGFGNETEFEWPADVPTFQQKKRLNAE